MQPCPSLHAALLPTTFFASILTAAASCSAPRTASAPAPAVHTQPEPGQGAGPPLHCSLPALLHSRRFSGPPGPPAAATAPALLLRRLGTAGACCCCCCCRGCQLRQLQMQGSAKFVSQQTCQLRDRQTRAIVHCTWDCKTKPVCQEDLFHTSRPSGYYAETHAQWTQLLPSVTHLA